MSLSPAPITPASREEIPTPATAAGGTSMASSSLWAAVSQVAVLGIQGVAAIAILLTFGRGADTDAEVAAYGVYGVPVVICQTLRLTIVARMVESPSPWAAPDRFLRAALGLQLTDGASKLALSLAIALLLTGDPGAH